MDITAMRVLLQSLLERLQREESTGKRVLVGPVSDLEYSALKEIVKQLGGEPESPAAPEPPTAPLVPLNLASLARTEPEDADVLLCLDFGTAMSKAFATRGSDAGVLPLEIGSRAGQVEPIYALASSMFITEHGRILFGEQAIATSLSARNETHRRIDSLKDIICHDPMVDLADASLESAYNPTSTPITKAGALTLFLAYLTDMATTELEDKHGTSRYVQRRFTLPVLQGARREWASQHLREVLARAQIVADTLHGRWQDGLPVTEAAAVLRAAFEQPAPRYLLREEGVPEPVAAVASRVRNYVCTNERRRLIAVVDVGAGTIDLGLFCMLEQPGREMQFWLIPGTETVLRQAGNAIDDLLLTFILDTVGVRREQHHFERIRGSLALRIRALKESLFRAGIIEFTLEDDTAGVVALTDFLASDGVKRMQLTIEGKFRDMLQAADSSWYTETHARALDVVFTGGGARLPLFDGLCRQTVVAGRQLDVRKAATTPNWVEEDWPTLMDEYLRLSVAIGGSSRSLPRLAPQTFQEFGGMRDGHIPEIFR